MTEGYAYCCCICKELPRERVAEGDEVPKPLLSARCGHLLHQQCLHEFFTEYSAWSTIFCPECREELTIKTDIVRVFPTKVYFPAPSNVASLNRQITDLTAQTGELSNRLELAFQKAQDSENALAQYKAEVEGVKAQLNERNTQYAELVMRNNQSYNYNFQNCYPVSIQTQEQMFNPQFRPSPIFATQFQPMMQPPPTVNFGPFPGPLMGMAPFHSGPLQQRLPIRPTPIHYNKRSVASTGGGGGVQNVPLPKLSRTSEQTITAAVENSLVKSMQKCSLGTKKKPSKTGTGNKPNSNGQTTVKDEEKNLNVSPTEENDEQPNQTTLGAQRTFNHSCKKCSLSWTTTLGGDNKPTSNFCPGCQKTISPLPI